MFCFMIGSFVHQDDFEIYPYSLVYHKCVFFFIFTANSFPLYEYTQFAYSFSCWYICKNVDIWAIINKDPLGVHMFSFLIYKM